MADNAVKSFYVLLFISDIMFEEAKKLAKLIK